MENIRDVFAFNLKTLRGKRTQADLAELAGIPFRTYQNMEVNGAIPQQDNLQAVAKALGVPETRLFLDPDLVGQITPQAALQVITQLVKGGHLEQVVPQSEHTDSLLRAEALKEELQRVRAENASLRDKLKHS